MTNPPVKDGLATDTAEFGSFSIFQDGMKVAGGSALILTCKCGAKNPRLLPYDMLADDNCDACGILMGDPPADARAGHSVDANDMIAADARESGVDGEHLFRCFMAGDTNRLTTTAFADDWPVLKPSYQQAWVDLAATLSRQPVSPPERRPAADLETAARALNGHLEGMQALAVRYLMPDGDADELINAILTALDGPDQRVIQNAVRDALGITFEEPLADASPTS